MLKGLLFDLDGVLTDSAKYHLQAWGELAKKLNITLPESANDELRGRSRLDSLNVILKFGNQQYYSEQQKKEFMDTKNRIYLHLIQAMTPQDILPGITDLLADAQGAGLRMAIASASRNAPIILNQLGIADLFAGVVDPATLIHGKPDPEIYERAQQLLHLRATEVTAFEDAVVGVQAIKGAGQFAVGIGNKHVLRQADYVVPTTGDLRLSDIIANFDSRNNGKESRQIHG
ncbi:beta-phosphoglucomutase [Lacticaseibacillus pantheris]